VCDCIFKMYSVITYLVTRFEKILNHYQRNDIPPPHHQKSKVKIHVSRIRKNVVSTLLCVSLSGVFGHLHSHGPSGVLNIILLLLLLNQISLVLTYDILCFIVSIYHVTR